MDGQLQLPPEKKKASRSTLRPEVLEAISEEKLYSGSKEDEWRRLKKLTKFEEKAYKAGYKFLAGIDEAGRGPLAGPVVAASCILPRKLLIPGVNDSKKLSPEKRAILFEALVSHPNVVYALGLIDADEIDRINIYQATIQAMLISVAGLKIKPDLLLVEGLSLPHPDITAEKIIDGDSLSQSIAAASILAKVTRDRLMLQYHEMYPQYGFDKHKGYGTEKHLKALKEYGPCPIHRKTFRHVRPEEILVPEEMFIS
jgi:ribonuclease HII